MVRKLSVTSDARASTPARGRTRQYDANPLSTRERLRRLAGELAKPDRTEEQALAEEGLGDPPWPLD